jgi:glycosyltransferase involved in cell wall biosynthesis
MAYGGIETALLNWLKTMDRGRFELDLFCFANPRETEAPFVDAACQQGWEVAKIPWGRWKPVLRAGQALAELIRSRDIEILHCHNTYANLVGARAAAQTGVKTVTTLYVWGKFGLKRGALQWLDKKVIRRFDRITAHCEDTLRGTIERGFAPDEVKLLTCGFSEAPIQLSRTDRNARRLENGAGPNDIVLINVARFWPEKAHDVLLEGLRLIRERDPRVVLWILGVGPDEPRIRALCGKLGLNPWVRFLGFRKDLPELLALADIQVHPSDMEGVPLAVCSGMAARLPIVASGVGGLLEILKHEHSAVLIPPRNPAALSQAVLDLIGDPSRREALGGAARRFIDEEYSLRAATARVEALYEEMISHDAPDPSAARAAGRP